MKKQKNTLMEKKSRVIMKKTRAKGWVTIGLTALAFLGMASVSNDNVAIEAATAKNNVAKVNYLKGYGVNLWKNAPAISFANKRLTTGSNWKTFNAVRGNSNNILYTLGNNQFADSKYLDLKNENSKQVLKGIAKINYKRGYGINIWSAPNGNFTGKRLLSGTNWKTFNRQVVNGKTWYEVGANQWIQGDFADLIKETARGEKVFLNGSPLETNPNGSDNNNNSENQSSNNGNTEKPGQNNNTQKPDQNTTNPNAESATVTVLHADENGTILDSDTKVVKVGETVTVSAKPIEGMEIVGAKTKTIKVMETSVEVTFTYKRGASSISTSAVENAFIAKLNAYRTSHGRTALKQDSNLMAASKVRAQQEAAAIEAGGNDQLGYLNYDLADHKLPNGQKFNQESHLKAFGTYVSENLIAGTTATTPDILAQKMLDKWVASTGHLANIMNEEFNYVGFSVVALSDGGFVGINNFGRR